jgi:hypothetical protein
MQDEIKADEKTMKNAQPDGGLIKISANDFNKTEADEVPTRD